MIDYNTEPLILHNPSIDTVYNMMTHRQIFNINLAVVDFDFNNVKPEFKTYKKFPFIPQKHKDSLIFTMRGEQVNVSGAELFRALQIGAITRIHQFVKIPTKKNIFR